MLTILIPALKTGFLESQLHWLSRQTVKDFTVVVMDSNYAQNRHYPWAKAKRTFNVYHLPVVHHLTLPKRYDYSIKNNLALLSPTTHFVMVSDTAYFESKFVEAAYDHLRSSPTTIGYLPTTDLAATAYDQSLHRVDTGGALTSFSAPALIFDFRTFCYILNGYDEAMTYGPGYETIMHRIASSKLPIKKLEEDLVYHLVHGPDRNQIPKRKDPCERCEALFPVWRFTRAYETGEYPVEGKDQDLREQMVSRDRYLGIEVFQCPCCGFCGALNPVAYEKLLEAKHQADAPASAFDGLTGRNLTKVHETMLKQVGSDIQAKMSYLMTTY